jgi:hypothetical protein
MGARSYHYAQEGDAFCLLEMNIHWCDQSQNNSKGPCEDAGGNRYKVSISTVKRVLFRHKLKGRTSRKKPLLQNRHIKARLQFATAHGDKYHIFWINILWSDGTKIELFDHKDHRYVWRKGGGGACKPKNTIPSM